MDPAKTHHLAVRRTARYLTLGDAREPAAVWFVLHGYGQLASNFIEPFGELAGAGRLVVAPEGLSRFYVRAGDGHVGASWMTSADREYEIADYVASLDAVAHAVLGRLEGDPPSIHVLGFSQGCETAARWAVLGDVPPDRLVLWGGRLPPDLDLEEHAARLRRCDLVLVGGSDDTWAPPDVVQAASRRLDTHGIPHRICSFEGGHRLDDAVLRSLAAV